MSDDKVPIQSDTQTRQMDGGSAVRLDACKLVQTSGEAKGREVELVRTKTVVGSGNEADVRVRDETVSRKHFQIGRDADRYVLRDLDSTNGTQLDGTTVREAVLHPGCVIRAGDVFFRFEPIFEQASIMPSERSAFGDIHGQSYRMRTLFTVLERVAPSEVTVLVQGETGTGKSALARAIHKASARRDGPFLVVDCGAIAPTLVESELFGHERGAFTGAIKDRRGAFELASGGTLFIDELTELAPHLQPKLLRALEEKVITRVGAHAPIATDCRVIAATQHDLWKKVESGDFRSDLYFRLAVVTVHLPPLRERREDLPILIDHFLREAPSEQHGSFASLTPELQRKLLTHDWPGNIRELRNTIQRIGLMYSDDPFVGARGGGRNSAQLPMPTLPQNVGAASGSGSTFSTDLTLPFKDAKEKLLAGFEREYVIRLLDRAGGNITKAAKAAGLDRKHVYNLMTKHGLGEAPDGEAAAAEDDPKDDE